MAKRKNRKLGKLPPKVDERTPMLARYVSLGALPAIPPSVDWGAKITAWGTMLNTEIGDCAVAALGHCVQVWTQNETGAKVTVPDSAILAAYEAISGYNPDDPSTDVGCVELDCLRYFRSVGVGGHYAGAFAQVNRAAGGGSADARWLDHLRMTIFLFGCGYIGLAMPVAWQATKRWRVPAGGATGRYARNGWGGHAIMLHGFRPAPIRDGGWEFVGVSWGERVTISANAMLSFCDEAWALLGPDWVTGGRASPSGINLDQLRSDLQRV